MMHACFAHASVGLAVDLWCVNETKANNLGCKWRDGHLGTIPQALYRGTPLTIEDKLAK